MMPRPAAGAPGPSGQQTRTRPSRTAPWWRALVGAVLLAAVVGAAPRPPDTGGPAGGDATGAERRGFTGSEWRTASPASQGLDPQRLSRGVERIGELGGVRSVLVVRNGRIVAEASYAGQDLNRRPHELKSASKSLLSALVGIALDRGWLGGLDSPVGELLPEYATDLPEAKRRITLADLLSMQAGLASTSREHYGAWVSSEDWTAAALARPLETEPGTEYTYSSGNSHLVSAILTEATGRSTLELAREVLLEPVGMEIHAWQRSPEGYYFGGNNLRMAPRDLARLGQLYLQEGRWNGRQVVPAEWVRHSTRRHAEGWPERYGAYGRFWWLPREDPWDSFAAIGFGGQFLYVVPELRMLVVMTSTLEGKGTAWDRRAFAVFREDLFGAAR